MDDALLRQLWPVFVEEAREHLQQISSGVLELERDPAGRPTGLLEGIRRTAHSLKGSAASLGLEDLEKLAHGLEGALVQRGDADRLEPERVEAMLALIDAGESALDRGDAGEAPSIETLGSLLARLAGEPEPRPAPAPTSAPGPAPSPIEQIWPVFRGEAQEYLDQLWRG